jgi:hypothetical protein
VSSLPALSQDAVITYSSGESVTLEIKQGVYSVYTQEKQSLASLVSDTAFITAHVASLRLSGYEKEQLTSNNPKVLINPVFEDGHGNVAHVDNKINLYMYEETTATALQNLLDDNKINLNVQEKFWREGRQVTYHTLAIPAPFTDVSIVKLTNKVNKLPGVKMAFPNLIHEITPSSSIHGITDTYYSSQWEHGKIESELAWAITM